METIKTFDDFSANSIGIVFARKTIVVKNNDESLQKNYHRISISPYTDMSEYDQELKDFCKQIWTKEMLQKFDQATKPPQM